VEEFKKKYGYPPGLAVIIVGDDPASRVYVGSKKRMCENLGIYSEAYAMPASTGQEELIATIKKLKPGQENSWYPCAVASAGSP